MFDEMDPDDRAELFGEMPGQLATQILSMMRPEEHRSTRVVLGYPADSVGRLMTPEYLALKPDWTVQQGLNHIRLCGRDAETVDVLYVIDDRGQLLIQYVLFKNRWRLALTTIHPHPQAVPKPNRNHPQR